MKPASTAVGEFQTIRQSSGNRLCKRSDARKQFTQYRTAAKGQLADTRLLMRYIQWKGVKVVENKGDQFVFPTRKVRRYLPE